jgi:hypothetical protein
VQQYPVKNTERVLLAYAAMPYGVTGRLAAARFTGIELDKLPSRTYIQDVGYPTKE